MEWTEIRDLARIRLGDPNAKIWSDALLLSYGNEILNELTLESEANIKRVSFPLIDGTRQYTLPPDFHELRGVRINGSKAFGTHAFRLEDLQRDYLTATGKPEWYYQEDTRTISFYPVPTWTENYLTIDQDLGVVIQYLDGTTYADTTSELGVLLDVVDTSMNQKVTVSDIVGEVTSMDTARYSAQVTYVYRPVDLAVGVTPDLPAYMHYAILYGVLREAYDREGPGQDRINSEYYKQRTDELKMEWFARNLEWSHGQDQYMSMQNTDWGADLDWRLRVWP